MPAGSPGGSRSRSWTDPNRPPDRSYSTSRAKRCSSIALGVVAEAGVDLGGLHRRARRGHQPVEALGLRQPGDRAGRRVARPDARQPRQLGVDRAPGPSPGRGSAGARRRAPPARPGTPRVRANSTTPALRHSPRSIARHHAQHRVLEGATRHGAPPRPRPPTRAGPPGGARCVRCTPRDVRRGSPRARRGASRRAPGRRSAATSSRSRMPARRSSASAIGPAAGSRTWSAIIGKGRRHASVSRQSPWCA